MCNHITDDSLGATSAFRDETVTTQTATVLATD